MHKTATILAAIWMALAAPLAAETAGQTNPVVVELYTSQGCSSCPPADKLLRQLAGRTDVLALALHVDYWDYIGWKDEYANPAHTVRQKGYAHAAGRNMIYTPQMIVMGQEDVVGAHAMELADLIVRHQRAAPKVQVAVRRTGNRVVIGIRPLAGPLDGPLDVHLVRFTPLHHAEITRGENAGRNLEYANVVDGWAVLGQWDGQGGTEIPVTLEGDRPAAVLVQRPGYGPILAAARLQ